MDLRTFKDMDQLSESLADWLVEDIQETLENKDSYSFVLTGGGSPKTLYRLLATSPRKEKIDWKKIHIYIGDERYVPFDDDRNNGKMAHETLLDYVPLKKENIHLMDTSLKPEACAKQYEELLHQNFTGETTFDFVLLGMGGDGHTLSLFPGSKAVHETRKWVIAPFVKNQDMYRITMTRPVVDKAKKIVFLAAGEGKAHAVKEVVKGEYQPDLYPAQSISQNNKQVIWFIDEAAASQL